MGLIDKTKYSKKFTSRTSSTKEDKYYQDFDDFEYNKISSEDESLRKEIILNYSLMERGRKFLASEHLGFDGTFQYNFEINDELSSKGHSIAKGNIAYDTFITIRKAGDKNDFEKYCDLEEFLLKEGFEKVEDSE